MSIILTINHKKRGKLRGKSCVKILSVSMTSAVYAATRTRIANMRAVICGVTVLNVFMGHSVLQKEKRRRNNNNQNMQYMP